jgi:hypothetical protein
MEERESRAQSTGLELGERSRRAAELESGAQGAAAGHGEIAPGRDDVGYCRTHNGQGGKDSRLEVHESSHQGAVMKKHVLGDRNGGKNIHKEMERKKIRPQEDDHRTGSQASDGNRREEKKNLLEIRTYADVKESRKKKSPGVESGEIFEIFFIFPIFFIT